MATGASARCHIRIIGAFLRLDSSRIIEDDVPHVMTTHISCSGICWMYPAEEILCLAFAGWASLDRPEAAMVGMWSHAIPVNDFYEVA